MIKGGWWRVGPSDQGRVVAVGPSDKGRVVAGGTQ